MPQQIDSASEQPISPVTLTGSKGQVPQDASGDIGVYLGSKLAGEDQTVDVIKVEQRFSYSHINAAVSSSGNVKTTPGFIHTVNINKAGSTGDTLTLSDGSNTVAVIDVSTLRQPIVLDCQFATNISAALTASATAADITISYR